MRYPVKYLFTRQQLTELTSVADDVLGYWLKEGLLVPFEADSRRHRRFSYYQLHVAVILNAMRSLGANVSFLRKFASMLQTGFNLAQSTEFSKSELDVCCSLARKLNAFRRGEAVEVFNEAWEEWQQQDLSVRSEISRRPEMNRQAISEADIEQRMVTLELPHLNITPALSFARSFSDDQALALSCYYDVQQEDFINGDDPDWNWVWLIWLDENGAPQVLSGQDSSFADAADKPLAGFYISVSKLIRRLWVGAEVEA